MLSYTYVCNTLDPPLELTYHFLANFALFLKHRGLFLMIMSVEGALKPASIYYINVRIYTCPKQL